ncbi:MAG: hypothetical protein LBF19_00520 [Prevotellaceae bacterium]|jgi:hypothetical protein|nr:hypothetical protein [Prevotellaceae bacterium]
MKKIKIVIQKVTSQEDIARLREEMKSYYNARLKGKTIVNRQKGISVIFSSTGRQHVLYARKVAFEKLIAITKLDEMVEYALFTNFKNPDPDDDPQNIIGYMNFMVPVSINNALHRFRLVVRITKDGKFYYDHAVKIK